MPVNIRDLKAIMRVKTTTALKVTKFVKTPTALKFGRATRAVQIARAVQSTKAVKLAMGVESATVAEFPRVARRATGVTYWTPRFCAALIAALSASCTGDSSDVVRSDAVGALATSASGVPAQRAVYERSSRAFSSAQASEIVTRLYLGLLGRMADPAGIETWGRLVADGRLHSAINGIVFSAEFGARRPSLEALALAQDLYRIILDREAEAGAAERTAAQIRSGILAERVADMILSPEYAQKNLGVGVDQAVFAGISVPQRMAPGASVRVAVAFRNTGTNAWREALGHRLGSQSPQDNGTWGTGRVLLGADEVVVPGAVKTFEFDVRAPTTPGRYAFQWRMLREGVRWFDASSSSALAEVDVTSCTASCGGALCGAGDGCGGICAVGSGCCAPNCGASGGAADGCGGTCPISQAARFVRMDAPSSLSPDESAEIVVAFENTGNVVWTAAAAYRLGSQMPQDNGLWGTGRVSLDEAASIAPGEIATFRFNIRAPSSPGLYDLQWRMVQDGVAWFGDFTSAQRIGVGARGCEALRAFAGRSQDASATIQRCIDETPAGGLLALPPGRFTVNDVVRVVGKPITLTTEGVGPSDGKCAWNASSGCAELVAAPGLYRSGGFFELAADGSTMDHIVLDGNRTNRTATPAYFGCASGNNGWGYNMRLMCSNCTVTNSVSKNALCGTALEVAGRGSGARVVNNTIASNGIHNRSGLWADGITVHDYPDSTFTDNEIIDNTDIDFVLGGCARCVVQRNVIRHSPDGQGSYAALMIQAWPNGTSGDYSGADFSANTIDCGPAKACGFGILIGSDPWYSAPIYGGSVHDNVIVNPQQGLTIEDASDFSVYRNTVSNRAATTRVNCNPAVPRATSDFSIGERAQNIDRSLDNPPASYVQTGRGWIGCIPNWAL
ncbi:MAG: right-handed parallel beta-helix repeat-containing protein [Deltaproteobacteria bacterium]|nr:right-handed parallel beta-helix repeat-containing protein [Deltaproteobacteria bacterium]